MEDGSQSDIGTEVDVKVPVIQKAVEGNVTVSKGAVNDTGNAAQRPARAYVRRNTTCRRRDEYLRTTGLRRIPLRT